MRSRWIFRDRTTRDGKLFLGSAFMVREDTFMTARHVIDLAPLADQEVAGAFAWGLGGERDVVVIGVTDIWTDTKRDIAVGRLTRDAAIP